MHTRWSHLYKILKSANHSIGQKADQWLQVDGVRTEDTDYKETQDILGDDGYMIFSSFQLWSFCKCIHRSTRIKLYILMWSLLFINYTSIKLLKTFKALKNIQGILDFADPTRETRDGKAQGIGKRRHRTHDMRELSIQIGARRWKAPERMFPRSKN